jgi:hypothetical protein
VIQAGDCPVLSDTVLSAVSQVLYTLLMLARLLKAVLAFAEPIKERGVQRIQRCFALTALAVWIWDMMR